MKAFLFVLALCLGGALAARQPSPAEQADRAMAEERYDDAIRLYQQLLKADPANTGYRTNLGIAFLSTRQYPKAAAEFEAVRGARPDFSPAALMLGMAYAKMDQPAKAIPQLREALETDQANYPARFELARCLRITGQLEEAAANYYKLAERNPNYGPAWQGLVLAYTGLARREANAATPSPAPACPGDPMACEYEAGRYWQIVEAVKADQSQRGAYWRKKAYSALADRAFATFAGQPPTWDTHELTAEIYYEQNRVPEAIEEWKQALEVTPDSPEVNFRLGEALIKTGKAADGRQYLQKAAKLGSEPARKALAPRK